MPEPKRSSWEGAEIARLEEKLAESDQYLERVERDYDAMLDDL